MSSEIEYTTLGEIGFFFQMFVRHLGGIGSGVMFACAILMFLALLGLWLPALILRSQEEPAAKVNATLLEWVVISILGGVCTAVLSWTVSCLFWKSAWLGWIVMLTLTAWNIVRYRNHLHFSTTSTTWKGTVCVTLVFLAAGCWHHGILGENQDGMMIFNSQSGDVAIHFCIASIIRDSGLPILGLAGIEEYKRLAHAGFPLLIAGFSSPLDSDIYLAGRSVMISSYLLLGWSLLVVVRRCGLTGWKMCVASVAPLCWTHLMAVPNAIYLDGFKGIFSRSYESPNLYHNGTQLWSLAVMSSGLFCHQIWQGKNRFALLGCVVAVVMSGLMKPSTAVIFGPALLILLILRRAPISDLLMVVGLLLFGIVIYKLPGYFGDLPPGPKFDQVFSLPRLYDYSVTTLKMMGVCVVPAAVVIIDYFRGKRSLKELGTLELSLIALGGGTLFASIFEEPGIRARHNNEMWGIYTGISLFIPFAIAWCFQIGVRKVDDQMEQARNPFSQRRGTISGVLLIGIMIQIAGAFPFTLYYPCIFLHGIPAKGVDVLKEARNSSPPGSRFLLDPLLNSPARRIGKNLIPYLGRPVLWWRESVDERLKEQYLAWFILVEEKFVEDAALLEHVIRTRDYAILHSKQKHVMRILTTLGWRRSSVLEETYEMWENPNPQRKSRAD